LPLPLPCILWPQPHGRPLLLSSLRAAWPWDRLTVLFVGAYKCHEDINYEGGGTSVMASSTLNMRYSCSFCKCMYPVVLLGITKLANKRLLHTVSSLSLIHKDTHTHTDMLYLCRWSQVHMSVSLQTAAHVKLHRIHSCTRKITQNPQIRQQTWCFGPDVSSPCTEICKIHWQTMSFDVLFPGMGWD
jgi:hypothetical protein